MSVAPKHWLEPLWQIGIKSPILVVALHFLALALAVYVAMLPFPLPPDKWKVDRALFHFDNQAADIVRDVRLPDNWKSHDDELANGRYVFLLSDSSKGWSDDPTSLLIPRFTWRATIYFNGHRIYSSASNPASETIARNTAIFVALPAAYWTIESNRLEVVIERREVVSGYLSQIYIGPQSALSDAFYARRFLFQTLPIVVAVLLPCLAVLLLLFWLRGVGSGAYAMLALGLVLNSLHTFNMLPGAMLFPLRVHLALHALPTLEVTITVIALMQILGRKMPLRWWMAAPGVVITASALLVDVRIFVLEMVFVGIPLLLLLVVVAIWTSARAALTRGSAFGLSLSLCLTVILAFTIHDLLVVTSIIHSPRLMLARLFYPTAVAIFAAWAIARLVQVFDDAKNSARSLEIRVQEAESRLRQGFEREAKLQRERALVGERTRLMSDLHDGVGGQLVSIVATAERPNASPQYIAQAARAALNDIRLVIDAMDDVDGELMMVLASWRDRIERQLHASDIRLDWTIENREGLPTFIGLRPSHTLNVLRILEEAVTNIIKHAEARSVEVRLGKAVEACGKEIGRIVVTDDGKGGLQSKGSGRGLQNMERRAAALGAAFLVESGSAGTRLQLDIPVVLPDI